MGFHVDRSGPEPRWLNQANLIAPGGEFTALIALDDNASTGFDAYDTGTNPAEGGGFEDLDHITRLKIQLHARN